MNSKEILLSKNRLVEKVNYGAKLFDKRWSAKRNEIIQRDGHKCKICQKQNEKLQVHHKQYHFIKRLNKHADPWDYQNHLMIALCESCHSRGHYKFKIPVKYI